MAGENRELGYARLAEQANPRFSGVGRADSGLVTDGFWVCLLFPFPLFPEWRAAGVGIREIQEIT